MTLVAQAQQIQRLDERVEFSEFEEPLAEDVPGLGDSELRRLAERILEDVDYQAALPSEEIEEREVPGWMQWLLGLRLPTFGLGKIILILLAIAAAALLVLGLVSMLRRDEWSTMTTGEAGSMASPAGPLPLRPVTLEEAQAAAARGAYGEAVHLLLLHTLGLLSSQQPTAVSKARTSREVLRRVRLQPLAYEALETLVSKTESWLFGGRELAEPDYRGCLEACRVIAQPLTPVPPATPSPSRESAT